MTSHDPAAEAAKKVWTGFAGGMFTRNDPEYLALLAAAREMATPVQGLHTKWSNHGQLHPQAQEILNQLAPLIYSDADLGGRSVKCFINDEPETDVY